MSACAVLRESTPGLRDRSFIGTLRGTTYMDRQHENPDVYSASAISYPVDGGSGWITCGRHFRLCAKHLLPQVSVRLRRQSSSTVQGVFGTVQALNDLHQLHRYGNHSVHGHDGGAAVAVGRRNILSGQFRKLRIQDIVHGSFLSSGSLNGRFLFNLSLSLAKQARGIQVVARVKGRNRIGDIMGFRRTR